MYAYLQGEIIEIEEENCILEVNNIGYNIRISSSTAAQLPSIGSNVRLYTYTSVREDAIQLMGFLHYDDLQMFRKLITVSGIGPKGGMAILGCMNADAVRFAIVSGDVKSLSQAPGVGKRSAERIIIDLKGKVEEGYSSLLNSGFNGQKNIVDENVDNSIITEACEALTALGYGASEALKAVKNVSISEDMEVEDVLKLALKELF